MNLSEPTGAPPPAPFNMRPYWQLLVLIVIFAAGPSVVVYLASALADLNHCTIVDAGPTPCVIFGQDRGGLLYDMATFVQVSFVTMPIGILLGFLWVSVLIISLMAWRRKRSGAQHDRQIVCRANGEPAADLPRTAGNRFADIREHAHSAAGHTGPCRRYWCASESAKQPALKRGMFGHIITGRRPADSE
jgi:hypothetical protein